MEFQVNHETVDYLQRLAYEVNGKSNLIDYVLTKHINDDNADIIDSEPFKKLMLDYTTASAEYEVAKDRFARDNDLVNKNWNIDFETGTCTVNA